MLEFIPSLGREWRHRDAILIILAAGNFAQLGSRLLISPLIPAILEDFTISKSEIGIALTGMWAMYALFQFPSGLLADRIGKARVIVAALSLTSLGGILIAFAPTFQSFRLLVVFLGVGTGMYLSVAGSLLTDLLEREGQALGFVTAGGAFAGLVAPLVASLVTSTSGWRQAILVWTVLPFAVGATLAYVAHIAPLETDDVAHADGGNVKIRETLSLLTRPAIQYSVFLASITMYSWQAFASFLPTFFVEYLDFTATFSGIVFGVFFLFSALLQPVMGFASDRFGRDVVLLGCLVLVASSLGLLLLGPTAVQALPITVALGVGCSWAGVVQARFMDNIPDSSRGPGFGLVRTIYLLVGSLGSGVTGTLADTVGWTSAIGFVGAVLLVAAAVIGLNRALGVGL